MSEACDSCGQVSELYYDEDTDLAKCQSCLSGGVVLDTPDQINMWVLLSRRHQLQLQLKGLKTPGLVKWCRENIPGAEQARTAKDCVVPVEYAIAQAGGEVSYDVVNVQILERVRPDVFQDLGVYPSTADVQNIAYLVELYNNGFLEVVLTLEDPRKPTGQLLTPA